MSFRGNSRGGRGGRGSFGGRGGGGGGGGGYSGRGGFQQSYGPPATVLGKRKIKVIIFLVAQLPCVQVSLALHSRSYLEACVADIWLCRNGHVHARL